MNSYMDQMRTNYSSWMKNAIGLEKEDWTSDRNPEVIQSRVLYRSQNRILNIFL